MAAKEKNPHTHVSRYYQAAALVAVFFAGLAAGYFMWATGEQSSSVISVRANDSSFSYINPLLTCSLSENKEFDEYKPLESKINDAITTFDPNHEETISVYYRDLVTGRWFGINEDKEYSPASLLKVPLMIAYFKEAETNPGVLSKHIYYDGNTAIDNSAEHYKSPDDIQPGRYYTVDELIASMIEHSDNSATFLLFNNINNDSLVEVMSDIGLKLPSSGTVSGTDDFMTVKSYSYLFRLLYNSTYLTRTLSEKALRLLSYSDFPDGIIKGLPQGVHAAQKFGERTVTDPTDQTISRELHDCGIVYAKNHPYLLCVMTKGNDFDKLSNVISSISKLVYDSTN